MKAFISGLLNRAGFQISRAEDLVDLSLEDREIVKEVMPFTMTSIDRIASTVAATRHIVNSRIPGDIVECGVWRGGSSMAIARVLASMGETHRKLYLYDTFTGMPAPTSADVSCDGRSAEELMREQAPGTGVWCYADLNDVRQNLRSTGYPEQNVRYVKGMVEATIPATLPSSISLLRLDTDWYESTRHEMVHLYPMLNVGGVLIIDDYGHWQGARQAVDEYFISHPPRPFLHRIDYTGRLAIKIGG